MARDRLKIQLAAIEAKLGRSILPSEISWTPADTAFFEKMFERARSGDRDWSSDDRERYHCLLLDEPWTPS